MRHKVIKDGSLLEPSQMQTSVFCWSQDGAGGQMVDVQRENRSLLTTRCIFFFFFWILKKYELTLNGVNNICLGKRAGIWCRLFARVDTRLPPEVQNVSLKLQTRWKSYFKRESVWEVVALKACVCKCKSEGAWCGVRLITAEVQTKWKRLQMSEAVLSYSYAHTEKQNSFTRTVPFWVWSRLIKQWREPSISTCKAQVDTLQCLCK